MKSKMSIIIQWLLLSSVLAIVSSCGNMSSVRNGKYIVAKPEKSEEVKNSPSDSELLAIYENEPKEVRITEETPANEIKETPIRKIPSLQEQMAELNSRQDNFDNRLSNIETQNNQISSRLDKITQLLEKEKDTQDKETATTGLTEKKSEKKEQFVLYPDEKVQTKKPKAKKRKVAPTKEVVPKAEEQKLFQEASNMVDNADYNGAVLMLLKEEQKLKDPSKLAECRYLIAKSFLSLNRNSQAKEYFAKVLGSNIEYEKKAEAQVGIASILAKSGETEAAKKAYQSVIDKYSTTKYVIEAKKMLQKL